MTAASFSTSCAEIYGRTLPWALRVEEDEDTVPTGSGVGALPPPDPVGNASGGSQAAARGILAGVIVEVEQLHLPAAVATNFQMCASELKTHLEGGGGIRSDPSAWRLYLCTTCVHRHFQLRQALLYNAVMLACTQLRLCAQICWCLVLADDGEDWEIYFLVFVGGWKMA